jgi:hypothetical protein
MKEVLTKSFWSGVKKTFYDALEEPPPESKTSQIPAGNGAKKPPEPEAAATPETPPASTR